MKTSLRSVLLQVEGTSPRCCEPSLNGLGQLLIPDGFARRGCTDRTESIQMADQHRVPQMMARRFAGDDGKLAELYKPSLALSTRRKPPKGILFGEDVYKDQVADLDDELFKPIEQTFALVYPSLVDSDEPHV